MLSARSKRILSAVVEQYVLTAQPVSSGTLVDRYALECSAATVRGEMVTLEEQGYVYQPHVSAGRIPTDSGYRAFVDAMEEQVAAAGLAGVDAEAVRTHYRKVEAELGELMHATTTLLSTLTDYAAIVLAPTLRSARVRKVDLVRLGSTSVLLVLITETGQVAKHAVEVREDVEDGALSEMEERLNRALAGRTAEDLERLRKNVAGSGISPDVTLAIIDGVLACLGDFEDAELYHGGTTALLEQPEFENPAMVRSLVELLDDGLTLVRTLSDSMLTHGLVVRIGAENESEQLDHMSLVATPYAVGGSEGVVGLLGPTRMDYPRAMTAVKYVAERLSESLDPEPSGPGPR
jgi:heat-inducible transcriptional repressor